MDFLESCFLKICVLIGPSKDICDFDLSFFVDEDVVRPDITYFAVDSAKIFGTADQTRQ